MKYIIPKNWHYSLHVPQIYLGEKNYFELRVKFTDSCRYNLFNVNQSDINKLWGISFGSINPHLNSIRIGWDYNIDKDQIDLYSYYYILGVRYTKFLCSLEINTYYSIELFLMDNSFDINVELYYQYDQNIYQQFDFTYPDTKLGVYLFPYFGGDEKATHKMIIDLKVKYGKRDYRI